MKRMNLSRENGSIFIVTLNVIIILSVILLSLSFNTVSRYRLLNDEIRRYQAYLNAKSAIYLFLKERNASGVAIPFKKQYILFNDEKYSAEVSADYVSYVKSGDSIDIQPAAGGIVRIVSIGKYNETEWKVTELVKGNKVIFYYGN